MYHLSSSLVLREFHKDLVFLYPASFVGNSDILQPQYDWLSHTLQDYIAYFGDINRISFKYINVRPLFCVLISHKILILIGAVFERPSCTSSTALLPMAYHTTVGK